MTMPARSTASTYDGPPPDSEDDFDAGMGVINALERTCELEARLRAAIQQTHPLTTTLDWNVEAADREREALLRISEQLEYLEDKLRELRFLGPHPSDARAVALSQLDGCRRELVGAARAAAPRVAFAKAAVQEVLAFATVGDEDAASGGAPASAPASGRLTAGSGGGDAVGLAPSPRRAAGGEWSPGVSTQGAVSLASTPGGKAAAAAGTAAGGRLHAAAAAPPPPAAAGGGILSSLGLLPPAPAAHSFAFSSVLSRITDEDIYGPPWPAPARDAGTAAPAADGVGAPRRPRRVAQLLAAQAAAAAAPGGDSASSNLARRSLARATAKAAADGRGAPSERSAAGASGSGAAGVGGAATYGGVVRVRDMLARAERGLAAAAASADVGRAARAPPRVLGDGHLHAPPPQPPASSHDGGEWPADGSEAAGGGGGAPWDTPSRRTSASASSTAAPASLLDWQIGAEPSPLRTPAARAVAAAAADGADASGKGARRGGGGLPALVGKLAGLTVVLGSIAAAALVAASASPGFASGFGAPHSAAPKREGSPSASASAVAARRRAAAARRAAASPAGRDRRPRDLPPWAAAAGDADAAPVAPRSPSPSPSPASRRAAAPGSPGTPSLALVRPPPDVTAAMG